MMFGTSVGALARSQTLSARTAAALRWVLAALAIFVAPALALGQVENVTPFYVAADREGVAIQCRIGSASYPVKVLKAGEVMKVDGQSQSIYRVEYPPGMSAYVKVEEAALEEGGKSLKLTKPSRLMAPNSEGGVSWWYLLEKELDAGTKLTVQKTVKGPDGKDAGYLVPAPEGSKGYIRRDFVRPATQAEIDKFLGKQGPTSGEATKPVETKPAETKPAETKPAETKPAETKPAETTPAKPGDGTAPKPPETAPTATAPGETKPGEQPAGTPPGATPADGTSREPQPAKASSGALKPADAKTLEKLFNDARRNPPDQVDLDATIAEFERTIESLKKEEGTERLRAQLESRLRVLKMRRELQATLHQTNTSSEALKQQADQAKAELAKLESMRQYTVVGRLVASSVYDGKQLPLMYRVLSPELTSTRTLAYVAPEATSNITDKVGKLVGVVGEAKFDESLRVNIVVPARVDVLGVVPSGAPSATPATSPAPATPAPSPAPAPQKPAPDENK
jgi:hypothetical protein